MCRSLIQEHNKSIFDLLDINQTTNMPFRITSTNFEKHKIFFPCNKKIKVGHREDRQKIQNYGFLTSHGIITPPKIIQIVYIEKFKIPSRFRCAIFNRNLKKFERR